MGQCLGRFFDGSFGRPRAEMPFQACVSLESLAGLACAKAVGIFILLRQTLGKTAYFPFTLGSGLFSNGLAKLPQNHIILLGADKAGTACLGPVPPAQYRIIPETQQLRLGLLAGIGVHFL